MGPGHAGGQLDFALGDRNQCLTSGYERTNRILDNKRQWGLPCVIWTTHDKNLDSHTSAAVASTAGRIKFCLSLAIRRRSSNYNREQSGYRGRMAFWGETSMSKFQWSVFNILEVPTLVRYGNK